MTKRPASDAWVVAPSNGFARIGQSANKAYGQGAGVMSLKIERVKDAMLKLIGSTTLYLENL